MALLEIKNLHVEVDGRKILNGLDLAVEAGRVHAVMGPNGSGKSTLAHVLAGKPNYAVTQGQILFDGEDVLGLRPDERAAKGIFLKRVREAAKKLGIEEDMVRRPVNVGFSGGEKKRNEVMQMALLEPRLCVLDETDSGLDIDALKIVAEGVNQLRSPERAFIVITHYQRLLNYIVPDVVHVLARGRIVRSGGKEIALELEAQGYAQYQENVA